jgi:hypothetical protein
MRNVPKPTNIQPPGASNASTDLVANKFMVVRMSVHNPTPRSLVEEPVASCAFANLRLAMCRNIKNLFNFDPPVTEEEVRAASLQFVRKISGFTKPSKTNESAFLAAVDEVAAVSSRLLAAMETTSPPKNREEEAAKAKARSAQRFSD